MASQESQEFNRNIMVGFIGGGRMAQAMAKGFINSGLVRATNIVVSDSSPLALQSLQQLGVRTTQSNKEVVADSELVVVAVKPNVVKKVLEEVSPEVSTDKQVFVSIAAGVTISSLEQVLPQGTRVIRVMPNTPSLVQAGASVLSPGSNARRGDPEVVRTLLGSVGLCEEGAESLLDAVTGLSGSGPAYAFAAIESMADGGVKMGLPRELALKLAAQTLLGAAKMVLETGKHPGQLKDEVCSPAGTTISAMHVLENRGFRASLIDAVEAATLRARELGASN
ncbi:pyrroline-5-carboxylate reductase 1, mitochondrial [Aplysia californica]|uniref:pyrroline-5-carboxylate reductase n=1 Tax=Aplysia californica TaxID=6500 RepID=A0ABM0JWK6_APLCA|nr:pyrroline-5-carboxylate reductase 1, mitochondrial [Aplysia californica]